MLDANATRATTTVQARPPNRRRSFLGGTGVAPPPVADVAGGAGEPGPIPSVGPTGAGSIVTS